MALWIMLYGMTQTRYLRYLTDIEWATIPLRVLKEPPPAKCLLPANGGRERPRSQCLSFPASAPKRNPSDICQDFTARTLQIFNFHS
jgi:hypothetical protein